MKSSEAAFGVFQLLSITGVGAVRVWRIIEHAKDSNSSIRELINDPDRLTGILDTRQINELRRSEKATSESLQLLEEKEIEVWSVLDSSYPSIVLHVLGRSAPPLLFCRGNSDLFVKSSLGFCGSRQATPKGIDVARECAELAVKDGINVVSGYAAGVDMATHRAAFEHEGTTTVVLAEGILNFRLKAELKSVWQWERALVLSEFLPSARWNVGNAMRRNRTICALCKAMVLIEARETGGSIEAGRACLDLGIPLFAPVYEGMPESAGGNRILLREGARSLYKNRSTNLPNLRNVLATVGQPVGSFT